MAAVKIALQNAPVMQTVTYLKTVAVTFQVIVRSKVFQLSDHTQDITIVAMIND